MVHFKKSVIPKPGSNGENEEQNMHRKQTAKLQKEILTYE